MKVFTSLIVTFVILYIHYAQAFSLHMRQFSRQEVLRPFVNGNALKIISGLQNFNADLVESVSFAANCGGASHIDIACRPDLVKAAKMQASNIPVCVSSVTPSEFVEAVRAGADMIEIGNFDSFYDQGIQFSSDDVIALTKETRRLLPSIPLSVTIPHSLSLAEQVALAKQLELCGADIIQTEGKVASVTAGKLGVQELIEIAAPTLASAYALSRAVNIPVMCASGLTDVTVPLALAAGAKGVGIGSMINKLKSRQQMLMAVSAIASAMGRNMETINADVESMKTADLSVEVSSKQSA